jgi:hypothetical protein
LEEFIISYPGLVKAAFALLAGALGIMVGLLWGMANGTLRDVKDAINKLSSTINSAFGQLGDLEDRVTILETKHAIICNDGQPHPHRRVEDIVAYMNRPDR